MDDMVVRWEIECFGSFHLCKSLKPALHLEEVTARIILISWKINGQEVCKRTTGRPVKKKKTNDTKLNKATRVYMR